MQRVLFTALICVLPLAAQNDVADAPGNIHPLLVGTTVPDLELATLEGETVRLMEIVRQRPTVLIFYRGGWCPFCSRQLNQLQRLEPMLKEAGYQIIAISPDRASMLRKTLNKRDLTYTLLSDSTMMGARRFGLAWKMADKQVASYKRKMMDIVAASGQEHHLLPVPGVFILDRKGMIHFQYVNPNHRVRLSAEVLEAAALSALK